MDIAAWLRELGFAQYEGAFRDNDIDADVLRRLTADDLRELGARVLSDPRGRAAGQKSSDRKRADASAGVACCSISADEGVRVTRRHELSTASGRATPASGWARIAENRLRRLHRVV